jgi:hypothetical protein
MAQINNYGYEKLRSYVLANWKYLEVQDSTGIPIKRFTVVDGLTITGTSTSTELEYKLVVTGDATFLSKTVAKSVLFDIPTSGNAIATEVFTSFTFESVDDQLTIIHKLQIPQIV